MIPQAGDIAATRARRRRGRARKPSRAIRRAQAPREPRAAALALARVTRAKFAKLEAVIERLLFPALVEVVPEEGRALVTSERDEDNARTRVDARLPRRITTKLEAIEVHLAEIFDEEALAAELEEIGRRVARHGAGEFRRVIGISIQQADPGVAAFVDEWRREQVAKIKSLAGQELVEITQLLEESTAQGARVETLRSAIVERFGVSKSKGDLLARDQTLTLNARITKQRQTNVGISEYIWTASGDDRVREIHDELDGTKQRWDTPPIMSPDGRTGHPGEDYQCRCTAFPVIPELKGLVRTPENQARDAARIKGRDRRAAARRSARKPARSVNQTPARSIPFQATGALDDLKAGGMVPDTLVEGGLYLPKQLAPEGARRLRSRIENLIEGETGLKNTFANHPNSGRINVDIGGNHLRWDGEINLGFDVLEQASVALKELGDGTISKASLGRRDFSKRGGLHKLIHEQMHAHSVISESVYGGGVVALEEVTTELLTRRVMGKRFGFKYPTPTGSRVLGRNAGFGYQNWIKNVRELVEGVTELKGQAAVDAIADAGAAMRKTAVNRAGGIDRVAEDMTRDKYVGGFLEELLGRKMTPADWNPGGLARDFEAALWRIDSEVAP